MFRSYEKQKLIYKKFLTMALTMKEWTPRYIRLRLTDTHQIKATVTAGTIHNCSAKYKGHILMNFNKNLTYFVPEISHV